MREKEKEEYVCIKEKTPSADIVAEGVFYRSLSGSYNTEIILERMNNDRRLVAR